MGWNDVGDRLYFQQCSTDQEQVVIVRKVRVIQAYLWEVTLGQRTKVRTICVVQDGSVPWTGLKNFNHNIMCRFLAYLGAPICMGELLFEPNDSLIKQSYAARESEEPLNGDGFGVGWYHHEISPAPAVFVSVTPAWNNRNLKHLAPKIRSRCIMAHVRAASEGDVSEANCHPFQYKNMLMMHNGGVEHFGKIKRDLCNLLSLEMYQWVDGQTDSQHLFALFLDHLRPAGSTPTSNQVADAFEAMIDDLKKLMKDHGILQPAYLNMVWTDGRIAVALRYVTDPSTHALTLYYSAGKRYVCEKNQCRMIGSMDHNEHAVLLVSEKLTDLEGDFLEVPTGHFVLVDEHLNTTLRVVKSSRT